LSQNDKLLRGSGSQCQTGRLGYRRSPLHKERCDGPSDDRRKRSTLGQWSRIAEWLREHGIGHCLTGESARRAACHEKERTFTVRQKRRQCDDSDKQPDDAACRAIPVFRACESQKLAQFIEVSIAKMHYKWRWHKRCNHIIINGRAGWLRHRLRSPTVAAYGNHKKHGLRTGGRRCLCCEIYIFGSAGYHGKSSR
jgi:hypothetical protein